MVLDVELIHGWNCVLKSSNPSFIHLLSWLIKLKIVGDFDGWVLQAAFNLERDALIRYPFLGALAWWKKVFRVFIGGELDVPLLDDLGGEGLPLTLLGARVVLGWLSKFTGMDRGWVASVNWDTIVSACTSWMVLTCILRGDSSGWVFVHGSGWDAKFILHITVRYSRHGWQARLVNIGHDKGTSVAEWTCSFLLNSSCSFIHLHSWSALSHHWKIQASELRIANRGWGAVWILRLCLEVQMFSNGCRLFIWGVTWDRDQWGSSLRIKVDRLWSFNVLLVA